MSIVMDASGRRADVVGHYTDSAGLLGITETGSFRATNLRHLNDLDEYYRLFDVIRNELQKDLEQHGDHFGELDKAIFMLGVRVFGVSLYSISFSTKTDLLSQWRGYSPGTQGYCLVFDRHLLEAHAEQAGWKFVKCQYLEIEELLTLAKSICRPLIDELRAEPEGGRVQASGLHNILFAEFGLLAASIKHPGFIEEDEYRLIGGMSMSGEDEVWFRPSPGGVIPFTVFRFRSPDASWSPGDASYEERPGGFAEVVLGPGNSEEKIAVASQVLRRHGYMHVGTSWSRIPFRLQ